MIYPEFLQHGDTIGITAPSAGVAGEKIQELEGSERGLTAQGYRVIETANVRQGGAVSSSASIRAAELGQLVQMKEVRLILSARGGDFLVDMLPEVDFDAIAAHPKWIQGYSDPTSLLYAVTTTLDIATIYGVNSCGFDMENAHQSVFDNLAVWRGSIPCQQSFPLHEGKWVEGTGDTGLTEPVFWQTPNGPVDISGRLLGGCLDCFPDFLGTRFDGTPGFLERYERDGIIWYFDVFALTAEAVYRGLWHLRELGYFQTARGFLFGRVLFPGSDTGLAYEEAIRGIIGDAPLVFDADVGHVRPQMTLINGAVARLRSRDGKGTLEQFLQ